MRPVVSVVMPTHERPLLLRQRSVPSVVEQTFADWELLVVGDGPNNASREAIEQFADRRLRYLEIPRPDYRSFSRQQLWHGAGAAARNHGVANARGEIIALLDDDDAFLPHHLMDCVDRLSAGDCDLVYGPVWLHDLESGTDVLDGDLQWESPGTEAAFLSDNILYVPAVAYSRRYAECLFPADGRSPADYACWLRMYRQGARFASLPRVQAIYYGDALTSRVRLEGSADALGAEDEGTARTAIWSFYRDCLVSESCVRLHEMAQIETDGPRLKAFLVLGSAEASSTLARHLACYRIESLAEDCLLQIPLYGAMPPEVRLLIVDAVREGVSRMRGCLA